jgi:S1-C subfamily serine protease
VLVTEETAQRFALDETVGLLVEETKVGGPAQVAGIEAGDVILKINGMRVDSKTIESPAFAFLAGETTDVTFQRKGNTQTVKIAVAAQEPNKQQPDSPPDFEALSLDRKVLSTLVNRALYQSILIKLKGDLLQIARLTEELRSGYGISNEVQGAVVIEDLYYALRPGEVITEVGGTKVRAPEDVARFVESARTMGNKSLPFTVVRDGRQRIEEISVSATDE